MPLPHSGLRPPGGLSSEHEDGRSKEACDTNDDMTCIFELLNGFYAFAQKVL